LRRCASICVWPQRLSAIELMCYPSCFSEVRRGACPKRNRLCLSRCTPTASGASWVSNCLMVIAMHMSGQSVALQLWPPSIISTNRLRCLGHVGHMEHGGLPHIALFSSLYGVKKRPSRGLPHILWEECVCADLRAIGISAEDWEAECHFQCAWRKRLWDFSHPGAAAAEFACLREKGCASSSTACRLPRPALLWYGSGNLDASTPLMF
jgi:hypothetical protein